MPFKDDDEILATMGEMWQQVFAPRVPESMEAMDALIVVMDYLGAIGKAVEAANPVEDDATFIAQAVAVTGGVATIGSWLSHIMHIHIVVDE